MPKCVVIADDLTGANATGVLLTRANLETYTQMNEDCVRSGDISDCDCVVVPTDSRGVDSKTAYKRVFNATEKLKSQEVKLYSKRIDSTLRGNLGSEIDAMLNALGEQYIAIVVPCFPKAGRVTAGGYVLVNSIPLHRSEAANDPKNPIYTSSAVNLIDNQTDFKVGTIGMDCLAAGVSFMIKRLWELRDEGIRVVICDAVTEDDMEDIAEMAVKSGIPFAAVDPGVFTSIVAKRIITPAKPKNRSRILLAVGSVNAVAAAQVKKLFQSQSIYNVYIHTKEILAGKERRTDEIQRVVSNVIKYGGEYEVCSVVVEGIFPEKRTPFEPYMEKYSCTGDDLSRIINKSIARIIHGIMASGEGFKGLYTCGGDISVAACEMFGTFGLKLIDEVVPLAAYGELMGGEFDGMKMITKGGMVGNEDALITIVQYLKEKLLS